MSRLQELQKRKLELLGQLKDVRDRFAQRRKDGKTGIELLTAEDRATWQKVNDDYDKVLSEIEDEKNLEDVERSFARRQREHEESERRNGLKPTRGGDRERSSDAPTAEDRALAMQAWFRRSAGMSLTKQHKEAVRRCKMPVDKRRIGVRLSPTHQFRAMQEAFVDGPYGNAQKRALSVVTNTAGEYTIPEGFVNNLEAAMLNFDGVEQIADIMTTDTGNPMPWPTVNDTSNTGEQLAENTSIGSSVDPTFGVASFGAYKFSSKLLLVPHELLEDSAFNMAAEVGRMLGERIGRISSTRFTTGNGTTQPQGVVTGAAAGVTAASATAIAADEVIKLMFTVDPAYQNNPKSAYMMHNNVLQAIRLLKDTTNQYLWQPSYREGTPDILNGRPVIRNQSMASTIATTNITMLYGDFSKFKIRRVRQIRLVRLNERYADLDQVGFVAFLRQDSKLLDAGTNPIKKLTQA